MEEKQYVARVIEDETEEIAYESKPTTEHRADKIAEGLAINLNWERFHIEVVVVAD